MKLIKTLILFMPIFSSISCSSFNDNVYIEYVYDGDTFYDTKKNRYRIFGIDTAENKNSKREHTVGLENFYATKAKEQIENLILFKNIKIVKIKKDRYGRKVVKAFVGDIDIGLLLVTNGLARVAYIDMNNSSPFYSSDFEYYRLLLDKQYEAYKKSLGIWRHKKHFKTIFPKS